MSSSVDWVMTNTTEQGSPVLPEDAVDADGEFMGQCFDQILADPQVRTIEDTADVEGAEGLLDHRRAAVVVLDREEGPTLGERNPPAQVVAGTGIGGRRLLPGGVEHIAATGDIAHQSGEADSLGTDGRRPIVVGESGQPVGLRPRRHKVEHRFPGSLAGNEAGVDALEERIFKQQEETFPQILDIEDGIFVAHQATHDIVFVESFEPREANGAQSPLDDIDVQNAIPHLAQQRSRIDIAPLDIVARQRLAQGLQIGIPEFPPQKWRGHRRQIAGNNDRIAAEGHLPQHQPACHRPSDFMRRRGNRRENESLPGS
jgi:hypothetical protein